MIQAWWKVDIFTCPAGQYVTMSVSWSVSLSYYDSSTANFCQLVSTCDNFTKTLKAFKASIGVGFTIFMIIRGESLSVVHHCLSVSQSV